MSALLLHPVTAQQLADVTAQPTHALALIGPAGSGKLSIARTLAEDLLELDHGTLEDYPYLTVITQKDGKAIGIEAVRELEQVLRLKVPSDAKTNRVVIIENAHTLTTEAQNALLKTLEEPPAGTVLILTVAQEQALLPTIRSRSQSIHIKLPQQSDVVAYFSQQGLSEAVIARAYTMSGGLIGLLNALLHDADHPLLEATSTARQLLGQNTYERLLSVETLSKQRQDAQDVLFILQQMAHISLQSTSEQAAPKWQKILTASYAASQQLSNSGQPKLVLSNLMLSL